jgi:hypothetical protein
MPRLRISITGLCLFVQHDGKMYVLLPKSDMHPHDVVIRYLQGSTSPGDAGQTWVNGFFKDSILRFPSTGGLNTRPLPKALLKMKPKHWGVVDMTEFANERVGNSEGLLVLEGGGAFGWCGDGCWKSPGAKPRRRAHTVLWEQEIDDAPIVLPGVSVPPSGNGLTLYPHGDELNIAIYHAPPGTYPPHTPQAEPEPDEDARPTHLHLFDSLARNPKDFPVLYKRGGCKKKDQKCSKNVAVVGRWEPRTTTTFSCMSAEGFPG